MDIGCQKTLINADFVRHKITSGCPWSINRSSRIKLKTATGHTSSSAGEVQLTLIFPNGKTHHTRAQAVEGLAETLLLGTNTMDEIPGGVHISRHPHPEQRRVFVPFGGIEEQAWSSDLYRQRQHEDEKAWSSYRAICTLANQESHSFRILASHDPDPLEDEDIDSTSLAIKEELQHFL
jgi:hypothetical protein